MKNTRSTRLILVFILISVFCVSTRAQVTTGTPPFGTFGGGPDILNLANLNSHINVPVFNKAGRGAPFAYNLSYDTSVWYPVGSSGSQTWTAVYNWGWRGQTEAQTGYISNTTGISYCYTKEGNLEIPTGSHIWYTNFVYHDPWGVPHSFVGSTNTYSGTCSGTNNTISATATDGSGYSINGFRVSAKNGNIINPPSGSGTGSANSNETNGNEITVNSSGQFYDTLSSSTPVLTVAGTAPSPTTFTYTAPSGSSAQYTMKYTTFTVQTNFGCSGIVEFGATSESLVSEIDLPNGTKYTFTYEATPGHSGNVTGRLASVTLPTGGTISYAYSGGSNGIVCADGSTATLTRTTPDGTGSYAHSENGSTWTTTETDPQMPYDSAANQTIYTFNSSAQVTQKKIYQGSSTSGTLLRTINTTWATNSTPATEITILEDNSTQSEIETTYDNFGNLLTLKEHDYGTGAPGSILRTTTNTYLSSSPYASLNIMDRLTEKTVADSTGTIQYREDYSYDGTTISPCPTGVPQHNDTSYGCSFSTRGNPTSFTTYTNAAAKTGGVTKNAYYDVFGNLVQQDVDCCESTTWALSSTTQYAFADSKTCGESGGPQLTTSYTYNAYTGQLASEVDSNNQTTSFTYDSMLRPLAVTRPDQSQITYTYNDTNQIFTVTTPIDGTHAKTQTKYEDGLARTIKETITDASQNVYTTVQQQYDPLGREFKRSNPYTTSAQYWTTKQYDALGRVSKNILQDSSQMTFSFSLAAITTTDPAGHQRKTQSDGLNRILTFFEPDPTNNNSLTLQTTYTYNVFNRAATITQGSQTRTFNYDGIGRLTSESHPENGTTSYQYNSFNKLTQRTDQRGVITTYNYDTMNRLAGISYNVGSTGVPATSPVSYSYGTSVRQYNNGRLITMTDGTGNTAYSYDLMGRKTQEAHSVSGTPYTTGYQYNLDSKVTSITYPSGRVVQRTFDGIGRSTSISSGATTYVNAINYNPNSSVAGFTLGNGVTSSLGYAADRLQPQSINYSASGSTLFGETFTYNQSGANNGEITGITDSVDSGRSMTYSYDSLNRLSTAVSQGSTNYPKWGLSWSYDRYGNRLSQTVTAGSAFANSVVVSATTNHITTSGYSYDANGNMTSDAVNTVVYDAENRAISDTDGSGTASYMHDGLGLRVQKSFAGTTTTYIFALGQVIAEYANGSLSKEYIYHGKGLLAEYDSGTLYYHGRDLLSDRLNMDAAGNIVGLQGHYPFGEDWYLTNTTTKWHFTTYERDSESGNDYAMHRFHVNRLGRFLTVDPMRPRSASPQLLNRYSYVASDPINRRDPSGLDISKLDNPECWWDPDLPECGGWGPGGGGGGEGGGGCNPDSGSSCQNPEPEPPPTQPDDNCNIHLNVERFHLSPCDPGDAWTGTLSVLGPISSPAPPANSSIDSVKAVPQELTFKALNDGNARNFGNISTWLVDFELTHHIHHGDNLRAQWFVSYTCEGQELNYASTLDVAHCANPAAQ